MQRIAEENQTIDAIRIRGRNLRSYPPAHRFSTDD